MKLKNFTLGLICSLITIQTFSQEKSFKFNNKNQYRFGLGVEYFKTLDLQTSPNLYQSLGPHISLNYSRILKQDMLNFGLNLNAGNLKPNNGDYRKIYITETDFYGVETIEATELILFQMALDLSIGYVHKLKSISNETRNIYLGGNVQEHLDFAPGMFNMGTINYLSFIIVGRAERRLKQGRMLTGEFDFPLASVVTRLPYHNAPAIPGKSDLETFFTHHNFFESVNHFQNFNLSLAYRFWSGKKMAVDVTCKTYWLHYNKPEHLTKTGNQLILGINF